MDFEKITGVEEVFVLENINELIKDLTNKADGIRNIIVIYEEKDGGFNYATTGFESDWEAIGMLEECKNLILNGKPLDNKEEDD